MFKELGSGPNCQLSLFPVVIPCFVPIHTVPYIQSESKNVPHTAYAQNHIMGHIFLLMQYRMHTVNVVSYYYVLRTSYTKGHFRAYLVNKNANLVNKGRKPVKEKMMIGP